MADGSTGFTYLELRQRRAGRSIRRLPQVFGKALKLVWDAGRVQFVTAAALQFVGAVGLAVQLLAGKRILERLAPDGARPRFGDLVPYLLVLAVASALVAFA